MQQLSISFVSLSLVHFLMQLLWRFLMRLNFHRRLLCMSLCPYFTHLASSHKIEEYRRTSWNSMRITLKAIYDQRYSTMYYLKAGQNDYIIMENLRHMLLSEDPNKPFLIGHVRDVSSRSVLAMYAFLHVYMACLFKFAVP